MSRDRSKSNAPANVRNHPRTRFHNLLVPSEDRLHGRGRRASRGAGWRWYCMLWIVFTTAVPPNLYADGLGGNVTAGAAAIQQAGGNLTVLQSTDRAIINWDAFSIGAGNSAVFQLPSASSAVLNRVTGATPSAIMGSLQSNGQVYLINPSGILIGPNASISVSSLVASTLNVADAQFMQGGALEFEGNSTAAVRNFGSVTANGGNIYLLGAHVENFGTMTAKNGTVGLAAGQSIVLSDGAHPQLKVRATAKSLGGTGVHNAGLIDAARAELIANGGNVYGLAINNSGTIRATGVAAREGRVFLVADGGSIESSGDIVARRSDGDGSQGGDVVLHAGGTDGSYVEVSGSIDVAGVERGGNIFMKGATINVGSADLIHSGTQPGKVILSLGPHSVVKIAEGDGDPLTWSSTPATTISGGLSGDPALVSATSSDQGLLTFTGGEVVKTNLSQFGNGNPTTDSSNPNGLQLMSTDPASPFLGLFTVELSTDAAQVPGEAQVLFSFEVLEPDGSVVFQHMVLPYAAGERYTFQAQGGELIQKAFITSSDLGYDTTGGTPVPNGDSQPFVNGLVTLKDLEVAAAVLIVQKTANPAQNEALFDFSFTDNSDPNFDPIAFELANGISISRALEPGSYTVQELLTAQQAASGWTLAEILLSGDTDNLDSVDLATGSATVQLDLREIVTVSFRNEIGGKIIVEKDIVGIDQNQTFAFQSTGGNVNSDVFSLADGQSATLTNVQGGDFLAPAQYTVAELVGQLPDNWDFTDVVLMLDSESDGTFESVLSPSASPEQLVNLESGQTLKLVFTNTERGRIEVTKNVLGGSTTTPFTFQTTYDDVNFTLTHDQTNDSGYLQPGAYRVSELLPEGWFFDGITVVDPSNNSGVEGPNAFVSLAPGEVVELTFNNTQGARIRVNKNAIGNDPTASFDFQPSYEEGSFSLSDGESHASGYLRPGQYNVFERLPEGWFLDSVDVVDPSGGTTAFGSFARVGLSAGELVELTYNNIQGGRIQVSKNVIAGDRTLPFTFVPDYDEVSFQLTHGESQTSYYLRPGAYQVSELVPDGWLLDNIQIDDPTGGGSVAGNTALLDLGAGETINVTFHNLRGAQIVVSKDTQPRTGNAFLFDADYAPSTFAVRDGESVSSGWIAPGDYQIAELLGQGGFQLRDIAIESGRGTVDLLQGIARVSVGNGEIAQVRFTNALTPVSFFKWDPIFPDGIGSGSNCWVYGYPDCDPVQQDSGVDSDDLAGQSSYDVYGR